MRRAAALGLSLFLSVPGAAAAQPAGAPAGKQSAPAGKQSAPAPASPAPAAPTTPPKPLADTLTGMAKAEYEAGKILFQAKDFENAIIKFQKAYELSSDPRLLWNVAVCQKELRRYTKMLATIRKLLADGGPLLTEQDRQDAAEIAKTVEAFVSPLKLTVSEPGAAVLVDGEKVGETPLAEPILVDVGTRKITVEKPGWKPVTQSIVVAGRSTVELAVRLERELHRGRVIIEAGPEDIISLDGKVVGRARYEGSLPSGGHTLRVTAPKMAAYQSEVVISDNQTRRVQVTLNPLPEKSDSTKWIWIAGGATLLAGGIIGGIFLFKPTDNSVHGTIEPGSIPLSIGGHR